MTEETLNMLLDEMDKVNKFQDGIMLLVRQEKNIDTRLKLLQEYDKAEEYYHILEQKINNMNIGRTK